MNGTRHRPAVLGLVLVAVLLAGPPAPAQTDITTGRIVGQVVDEDGQPLPGASIEARNPATGLAMAAVTDARGLYRIVNVPIGRWDVSASLPGFQRQNRTGVTVNVASAVTADFRLGFAGVDQAVTVTSEATVVETTQTATQSVVDGSAIQSLPIAGRNFTDFVLLTPNSQRETQRGNLSLSGQRGIATNVAVDGVDFTNAFFGGTTGAAEGRAPIAISQESVREFQVVQSGASAEYGRSGGGFVNVVTKSGSNEWKGSAFAYYRPSEWTATRRDGVEPGESEKTNLGGSLGGPVLADRLFFFASYEQQRQDETVPLGPSVAQAEAILLARHPGYPGGRSGADFLQTQDADVWFGRLDLQLGERSRVTGRVNHNAYEGLNGTYANPTFAESYNGLEGLETTSAVAQWNAMLSASLFNDLNAQYVKEGTPRGDKGIGVPDIQVAGGARLGEVSFLPILADQYRLTLSDSVTWLAGSHVAKAGVEYNDTGMDQVFKGNWRGVFVFAAAGGRTALQNLEQGFWNEYREFIGLGGRTADEAGRYDKKQREYAVFLQDQWYLGPKVTVSAGLRYEYQDNPDDPVLDRDKLLDPASGLVTPDARMPDAKNQLSPRLSVAYSPTPSSVVRASAGRYYSRFPAILTAQLYTSNGVTGTQYVVSGVGATGPAAGSGAPGWGPDWDPTRTQQLGSLPAGTRLAPPGVFTIDPDFRNSHTDQATLGGEVEILGVSFGLEGIWAKGYHLQRLGDVNLVRSSNPAVDCPGLSPSVGCYGRIIAGRRTPNRLNPSYARISQYTSDARSEFWSATFRFRRNFASGLRFFGSVTRASDRDSDSNERNFSGIFLEDVFDPEINWGYSDRDQEWKFLANASWDFRITKSLAGFAGAVYVYQTGRPFTPRVNVDMNNDGIADTDRPVVGGAHLARNSYRLPDFTTLDLRVGVGLDLGPGRLSVLAECFNCANSANRGLTAAAQQWGTGATPPPTFGVPNTVTNSPRAFQAALRYDF